MGLWADTNDNNFLIEGNWIEDNDGQAIFWEISYNIAIRNNVIRHNLVADGPGRIRSGDNFPDAAIYISESGGDARVPYGLVGSPTVDISNNLIEDNYNGVALVGERGPVLRFAEQHLDGLLHVGEPDGGEVVDLHGREHCDEAVLRRLSVEDPEREGAPQHVQDEPAELLQLLGGGGGKGSSQAEDGRSCDAVDVQFRAWLFRTLGSARSSPAIRNNPIKDRKGRPTDLGVSRGLNFSWPGGSPGRRPGGR